MAILCLIGRASLLRFGHSPDGEMFVLMGKLVAEGKSVGIDLIDVKSPSVGMLLSVPYRLFGGDWLTWGIASLAAAIFTVRLLTKSMHEALGSHAALVTLVVSSVLLSFQPFVHSIFQLEHLLALLSAIGAFGGITMLRSASVRGATLLGLATGMAILLKPTGASVLVAALFAIAIHRGHATGTKSRMTFTALLGTLLPCMGFAAYLIVTCQVDSFFTLTRQIASYQSHSVRDGGMILERCIELSLIVLMPILIATFLTRRGRAKSGDSIQSTAESADFIRAMMLFTIAWLSLEWIGAMLQGRTYPYYFLVLACPAAMLAGIVLRRGGAMTVTATFAPAMALSILAYIHPAELERDRPRVAIFDELARRATPDATVWANDWPRLSAATKLQIVSAVPHYRMMVIDDESPAKLGNQLLHDLSANHPDWIVLPLKAADSQGTWSLDWTSPELAHSTVRKARFDDFLSRLAILLDENYAVELQRDGWAIFRRVDRFESAEIN